MFPTITGAPAARASADIPARNRAPAPQTAPATPATRSDPECVRKHRLGSSTATASPPAPESPQHCIAPAPAKAAKNCSAAPASSPAAPYSPPRPPGSPAPASLAPVASARSVLHQPNRSDIANDHQHDPRRVSSGRVNRRCPHRDPHQPQRIHRRDRQTTARTPRYTAPSASTAD